MLRYRIYEVITHPKFPTYAYWASWTAFVGLFYLLWVLPEHGERVFISENALSPMYHSAHIQPPKQALPNYQGSVLPYLVELFPGADIEAYPPSHPSTYSFLFRSPRATGYECMALVLPFYEEDLSSVELGASIYRYLQQDHKWLGKNLLFLIYKAKAPYAKPVRDWLTGYFMLEGEEYPRYYGLIRLALVLDISKNFDYITVLHDGINGQQVDVDLLTASLRILESSSSLSLVHPEPLQVHPQLKQFAHLLGSWERLILGNTESPHAYFLQ
jgi:hypothetical protein